MPRRPVCTAARAWTAWAPTAACARQAMGAPAASWTWTSARASRARTGASATTWSTGELRERAAAAPWRGGGGGCTPEPGQVEAGGGSGRAQPGLRPALLQVPVRLCGHGLRGRALRAGGTGVRVGALREQRVLPRGPRELPLPLLARCVCVRVRVLAPRWRRVGAREVCARALPPLPVCL